MGGWVGGADSRWCNAVAAAAVVEEEGEEGDGEQALGEGEKARTARRGATLHHLTRVGFPLSTFSATACRHQKNLPYLRKLNKVCLVFRAFTNNESY